MKANAIERRGASITTCSVIATSVAGVAAAAALAVVCSHYMYSHSKRNKRTGSHKGTKSRTINNSSTVGNSSGNATSTIPSNQIIDETADATTDRHLDIISCNNNNSGSTQQLPSHVKREIFKEQRRQQKMEQFSCKKPVYDNMAMFDPQNQLLCTISKKKAAWYLKKELAVWVDENERTAIRLLFEPNRSNKVQRQQNQQQEQEQEQEQTKTQKFTENDITAIATHSSNNQFPGVNVNDELYLKSHKANQCVCCGSPKHIRRHYVVPYAYRKHFPPRFKSHLSHDVVILCSKCQLNCEHYYQHRMKELEEECSVDLRSGLAVPYEPPHHVDSEKYQVRSRALALLRWKDKLPEVKVQSYECTVREYLGVPMDSNVVLTSQQLQEVIDVEYRTENPNHVPGPKIVVASLHNDEDKITAFVMEWRHYFVDTMSPHHLPRGWSVGLAVMSTKQKHLK